MLSVRLGKYCIHSCCHRPAACQHTTLAVYTVGQKPVHPTGLYTGWTKNNTPDYLYAGCADKSTHSTSLCTGWAKNQYTRLACVQDGPKSRHTQLAGIQGGPKTQHSQPARTKGGLTTPDQPVYMVDQKPIHPTSLYTGWAKNSTQLTSSYKRRADKPTHPTSLRTGWTKSQCIRLACIQAGPKTQHSQPAHRKGGLRSQHT